MMIYLALQILQKVHGGIDRADQRPAPGIETYHHHPEYLHMMWSMNQANAPNQPSNNPRQ